MGYIKLKKLIVSGPEVADSIIEFGNKLTIIAGPSNTGKTYIYRCLDYVFGAKNEKDKQPLDIQDGYDTIKLVIETDKGNLTLSRVLNSNETIVCSENLLIESGTYVIKESKKNNKTINKLFLSLLGLKLDLKLPSNKDGKPESFTWRTIKKAFFVDEDRADKTESILLPREGQTLYISSLIYFLTDDELDNYKIDDDAPEIKAKKRKAIVDYIISHKSSLETKKAVLENQIKNLGINPIEIESQIEQISNEILSLNDQIERVVSESKQISCELIEINERLNKNQSIYGKFETLKKQYESDISRLSFIVDNESLISDKKKSTKCPYCESFIVPKNSTSFVEASRTELMRVIKNANELDETSVDLKDKIDDDLDLIDTYNDVISKNKSLLNNELLPKRNKLKELLSKLNLYISTNANIMEITKTTGDLEKDIEDYSNAKDEPLLKFKAKEQLFSLICSEVVANSELILNTIGYPNVSSVEFGNTTLDLTVNGKQKLNQGKGFKAFTNSILLLAFRKYIEEHSKHKVGLYFFDSPLKGLHLPEGIDLQENIRKGFFDYLIGLETNDQLIILENTSDSELPELEINEDTKIYKFTKSENGRYGFLLDVK